MTEDEDFSDVDDDEPCWYCEGDAAARRGEPESANPHKAPPDLGPVESYEHPHTLWALGYGFARAELDGTVGVRDPGGG